MTEYSACPLCKELGLTSTLHLEWGEQTLIGWGPYFDEVGKQHWHDPNHYVQEYKCSQGHQFKSSGYKACPECGYRKASPDDRPS